MGGQDVCSEALRALGVGVAVVDPDGRLVGADADFLELHGIPSEDGGLGPDPDGLRWPAAVAALGSRLAGADCTAVEAAWAALFDGPDRSVDARGVVGLEGGRALVVGRTACTGPRTVLVAAEVVGGTGPVRRQDRLAHEVNNALGGMLAHLYLALADLESDHPARRWIEAVDQSAATLRERLLQAQRDLGGGVPGA